MGGIASHSLNAPGVVRRLLFVGVFLGFLPAKIAPLQEPIFGQEVDTKEDPVVLG